MAVKILIKRKFKKEALKYAPAMLLNGRSNAMGHSGYLSTETLVGYEEPQNVVIISMWRKKEDWDAYKESETRKSHESQYAELLEGETTYEIFKLGM